jgi:hypothetical protein
MGFEGVDGGIALASQSADQVFGTFHASIFSERSV